MFHHHGVTTASLLKLVARQTSKGVTPKKDDSQNMATKIWINVEGQGYHVCMCGLYHGWSIYGYNIVNMTRKWILGYIHRFGSKLIYGGQKWAI